MDYNYTAYCKSEEERIRMIAEDILKEYPNLKDVAFKAAKLEKPFGRVHEDYELFSDAENHINRLLDIIIVTEDKPEFQMEYKKACTDLLNNYDKWKNNYTYSNIESQPVSIAMKRFNEHNNNKEVPLITINEATTEVLRIKKEKELNACANVFRNKFPSLGVVASEVIKIEDEGGIFLRWIENDIIRLVTVLKITEGKEEYNEVYYDALSLLKDMYSKWLVNEAKGRISPEQQLVVEMMNRLSEHLEDKNIPISTYFEIKKEIEEKQNNIKL